ncbi:UDP-N-acetylmuramoylalanyl-D-glutamate--2, 6-diaminopimelate ligase [Candidatus Phycorickettsia trachydisci]|uniref:UDP-N-acetylmuramoyl-L-alanyl-D-glutamate--2,6-diaminopimelate ligase n=1 Tax=Candidatus Phycorickettsia trachydisci TaxID=2115978 RepID=A0A2P1P8E2_9RICK|nr:UDP-N-acetylmuramoyl-L-alanyl-D-glutamate--2,6-diaminopimelate ligase [Candidatus Phycorickettsia trachydisci]AVP87526.1 UDP-N-acetylmuramoylalanyl-D-glutamate--2, 6-diaminopimelate ligase [Candidatus Phycorickettsia trachydisci]
MPYKKYDYILSQNPSGICIDSRIVSEGEVFFVPSYKKYDPVNYINQALDKGAKLVVTDHPGFQNKEKVIYVENVTRALWYCADKFYSNLPRHKIAITGTNGKTSTTDYVRQIFILLGQKAGSIGTLGAISNVNLDNSILNLAFLTSNDLITNYKILSQLKEREADYACLEGSSLGIHQGRLGQIKFDCAAFTSFSQDHLDYHHTLSNYFQAKLDLFRNNLTPTHHIFISEQVCNIADEMNFDLPFKFEIIGESAFCDARIDFKYHDVNGQLIQFVYHNHEYAFETDITTKVQGYNLVFAALLVHKCGFSLKEIMKVIPHVKPVAGRMQKIPDPKNFRHIFVDFAHDPYSLQNILLELQKLKNSDSARIFCIFGCGGDRDKLKRPIMGKVASELADQVIVTDDNPRSENPQLIRSDIIHGITKGNYIEIADRKIAIKETLKIMNINDILLVTGKGHEDYQIYGNHKMPFSDVEIIEQCLSE